MLLPNGVCERALRQWSRGRSAFAEWLAEA